MNKLGSVRTSPFDKGMAISHEKEILNYFGHSQCVVDEHDSRFDKFSGFFILFTNRCGSNSIAEDISKIPQCGLGREIFNSPMVIKNSQQQEISTFADYIYYMCKEQNCLSPGVKVGVDQLLFLYESGVLEFCLRGFKFILIQRRDLVSQAVSYFIANTTKQWQSFQPPSAPVPKFDDDQILNIMKAISTQNAKMRGFLSLVGAAYHEVIYEEYFADPVGSLEVISQFLGVKETNFEFSVDDKKLKKQSSGVNTDYIDRIRQRYGIYVS